MSVKYRTFVYAATGSTFAVGTLLAEFENVKNIGWAKYLNDVGEAFFTVNQDDAKLTAALRAAEGTAHVFITRDDEVVWRGILSEHEATEDDVVFYCYGYESVLFWLDTKWNQTWTGAKIGTIVSDLWTLANTGITYSQLGFATTGTIQNPVTASGGAVDYTLPSYKAYYKKILYALKELTSAAISDTTNTCYFELAYTTSLTGAVSFNLWKNKSTDQSLRWSYPDNVSGFFDRLSPILGRNDISAVGSGAHNQLYLDNEAQSTGAQGYQTIGRRQEPIYLYWVRDSDDLGRVTKLRLQRALRADTDLTLTCQTDAVVPIGATNANHALGDRVHVYISKGVTQIDKQLQVLGEQVVFSRGAEHVRPMLADRAGV